MAAPQGSLLDDVTADHGAGAAVGGLHRGAVLGWLVVRRPVGGARLVLVGGHLGSPCSAIE